MALIAVPRIAVAPHVLAPLHPGVVAGIGPKPRLAQAAAGPAPSGTLTPGQIAAQVSRYKATLPAPLTDAQIQQRARAELDPLVQRLTGQINTRAAGAAQAIRGYTDALAGDLGNVDYGAPYVGAQEKQAAVDASLAQALTGGGTQLAGDLSSRLAQIGEPGAVGEAANAVAATGAGNAGATLATGGAALGALIANEAAARSYGAKLPGIARLAGLQDIAGAQQTAATDISQGTGQILDQLPSIVNDLRTQSATYRSNRAQSGQQLSEYLQGRNTMLQNAHDAQVKEKAATILSLGVDPATGTLTPAAARALGNLTGIDPRALAGTDASTAGKLVKSGAPKIIGSGSAGYYSVDPATGTATQIVKPHASSGKGSSPRIIGSAASGYYRVDPATGKTTLIRPPAAAGGSGGGGSLPSGYDVSKLVDGWKNGHLVTVHQNGTVTSAQAGQLDFQQAYKRLRAMGFADVKAREYLDSAYKRGEQGRAWLTNEEQAALGRAKLPTVAAVVTDKDGNAHGILRPAQVQALRAAHRLPPGQLTAEGAYVIAQVF